MPIDAQTKQTVFPSAVSPEEVIAKSKLLLPITDHNTLISLLMTYHNSLMQQKETKEPTDEHY